MYTVEPLHHRLLLLLVNHLKSKPLCIFYKGMAQLHNMSAANDISILEVML